MPLEPLPSNGIKATKCSRPLKAISPNPALVIFRHNKVGLLEVGEIDRFWIDELGYGNRLLGGNADLFQFLRINDDVFAFAVLVALHDIGSVHWLLALVYKAMMDAFMGAAIDFAKRDLALGLGSGIKLNPKGDQRDLNVSRPIGTGHAVSSGAKRSHARLPARLKCSSRSRNLLWREAARYTGNTLKVKMIRLYCRLWTWWKICTRCCAVV